MKNITECIRMQCMFTYFHNFPPLFENHKQNTNKRWHGSADSILAAKNEKYQIKVNFIAEHLFFLTFSTSLLSLI